MVQIHWKKFIVNLNNYICSSNLAVSFFFLSGSTQMIITSLQPQYYREMDFSCKFRGKEITSYPFCAANKLSHLRRCLIRLFIFGKTDHMKCSQESKVNYIFKSFNSVKFSFPFNEPKFRFTPLSFLSTSIRSLHFVFSTLSNTLRFDWLFSFGLKI